MKIAVIGNSFFAPKLVKKLNSFDKNNRYIYFNTNESFIDKIKFALAMPYIDIVYSISASVSGGGALNLALTLNKKIVQHFIGSDVLTAIEDYKKGNVNKQLVNNSKYLCEVEWIQKELKEININAIIQSYCTIDKIEECKLPNEFSVLTYIGKGKEDFYGLKTLIEVASNLKEIEFKVAGVDKVNSNLPSNVTLLGWVDMYKELQNSVAYIRNTYHDGLSFSVIEALSLGRYVFRNYKFPYTSYFRDSKELIYKIEEKKELFDNGKLEVNKDGINFVKKEFSKERVLKNIMRVLMEK